MSLRIVGGWLEKSVVLAWWDCDTSAMDGGTAYRISAMAGSAELAAITERLLSLLPSWFGIPEANTEYVASAGRLPGLVAHAEAGTHRSLVVPAALPSCS